MSDMKFKFTIQPYQTEAVESVTNVFAGQPFNDCFTYQRDVHIERDVTNWRMTDEEFTQALPMQVYSSIRGNCLKIFAESRHAII